MYTHHFRAALAAAAILLPMPAGADIALRAEALLPTPPLAVPAATPARAQNFQADRASNAIYEVSTIRDRLTESTRVTVALKGSSRPFGLGSRIWLDVSFTHSGGQMSDPPEAVVLTLESFTPARGGWAFAHPQPLRVVSGESVKLELPATEYEKLGVGLFDGGRREMLSFRIRTEAFVAMAAEPELELKAGNATMRLRGRAMDMLRDVTRRLKPATAEAR
jgi:hypothetical protein